MERQRSNITWVQQRKLKPSIVYQLRRTLEVPFSPLGAVQDVSVIGPLIFSNLISGKSLRRSNMFTFDFFKMIHALYKIQGLVSTKAAEKVKRAKFL